MSPSCEQHYFSLFLFHQDFTFRVRGERNVFYFQDRRGNGYLVRTTDVLRKPGKYLATTKNLAILPQDRETIKRNQTFVTGANNLLEIVRTFALRSIRIYDGYMRNIVNGETFHSTAEIERQVALMKYSHDSLKHIKSIEQRMMTPCVEHRCFFFQKCQFCARDTERKSCMPTRVPALTDDDFVDLKSLQFFNLIPYPTKRENAFHVVCTWDFETVTTTNGDVLPIGVCGSFHAETFTSEYGIRVLHGETYEIGLKNIWEQFYSYGTHFGFKRHDNITEEFGLHVEHQEAMFFFSYIVKPRQASLQKSSDTFVKDFVQWLQLCYIALCRNETVEHIEFLFRVSQNGIALELVAFFSVTHNGSRFDELLIVNRRFYLERPIQKFDYVNKNGSLYKMNLRMEHESPFTKNKIVFVYNIWDLSRHWTMPLRDFGDQLGLEHSKGDISFELMNVVYDDLLDETIIDWRNMEESQIEMYSPYDREEVFRHVKEDVRKYHGGRFNLKKMIRHYCMNDVVVTVSGAIKLQEVCDSMCDKLFRLPCKINTRLKIGTPAVARRIVMLEQKMTEDIPMIAPQNDVLDFFETCKYGGRSDIFILGKIEETVRILDVNAMYACCMTGPFPKGIPVRPSNDTIDEFEAIFECVRAEGWKRRGEAYLFSTIDRGFLFAHYDAIAPSDPKRIQIFSPVPFRTKKGLAWSNESRRSQPMSSINAELLARSGYTIRVVRSGPLWFYSESTEFLGGLVKKLIRLRQESTNQAENLLYKYTANSIFGKLCEQPIRKVIKILGPNDHEDYKYLEKYDDYLRMEENANDEVVSAPRIEYRIPIPDPYMKDLDENYDGRHDCFATLVRNDEAIQNRAPTVMGIVVLDFSRFIAADFLNTLIPDSDRDRDVEDKTLLLTASETDSFHLVWDNVKDRFDDGWISETEVGSWNADLKRFVCYLKDEKFKDGTQCVSNCQYVLSKKSYCMPHPVECSKEKIAAKGLNKFQVTQTVFQNVLDAAFLVFDEDTAEPFVSVSRRIDISGPVFKRRVYGTRCPKDMADSATSIKSQVLTRRMGPHHITKRISTRETSIKHLGSDYIRILPTDDRHPTDRQDLFADHPGSLVLNFLYDDELYRDPADRFGVLQIEEDNNDDWEDKEEEEEAAAGGGDEL